MKHYKYRKQGRKRPDTRREDARTRAGDEEHLIGQVKGKKASDLAERFANALDAYPVVTYYKYSVLIDTPFQIPGQKNEVDFFVYVGVWVYPIEIDGEMAHKTAEQKAHDMIRDQQLDPVIKKKWPGARNIQRIPGAKVQTRDDANLLVRSLF